MGMEIAVSDRQLIEALAHESIKQGKITPVHLHVETGMNRFGCRPEHALALAQLIMNSPSLKLEGIMTHFSSAETTEEDVFTTEQVRIFDSVIKELRQQGIEAPWQHAANSSGAIRLKLPQYNMVRLGYRFMDFTPRKQRKKRSNCSLRCR